MHDLINTQIGYSTFEDTNADINACGECSIAMDGRTSPKYKAKYTIIDLPYDVWNGIVGFADPEFSLQQIYDLSPEDQEKYLQYILSWQKLVISIKLREIPPTSENKSARNSVLRCVLSDQATQALLYYGVRPSGTHKEWGRIKDSLAIGRNTDCYLTNAKNFVADNSLATKKADIPYGIETKESARSLLFFSCVFMTFSFIFTFMLLESLTGSMNGQGHRNKNIFIGAEIFSSLLLLPVAYFLYNFFKNRQKDVNNYQDPYFEGVLAEQEKYTKTLLSK